MLYLELDRTRKRSYAMQIYSQLRAHILCGTIPNGARLPSTRALSAELHVSRNTVLTAYETLTSEGFTQSIPGSGLYVIQDSTLPCPPVPTAAETYTAPSLSTDKLPANIISFDSGIPALDLFPRSRWNTAVSRVFREAPASVLGYDSPQGRPELRAALATYLNQTRGIRCHPDQIVITSGAKQGLTLIAKCLLKEDREVILEDPSNRNVRQIFSYHTRRLTPVPVDQDGIRTDLLPWGGSPALVFVTPSHQFPMGGVLSM